jgi:hypothetical protein
MTGPSDEADKMVADQMRDLMDAYAMHDISRDEFIRRMADILGDWKAAHAEARMIRPENEDHD